MGEDPVVPSAKDGDGGEDEEALDRALLENMKKESLMLDKRAREEAEAEARDLKQSQAGRGSSKAKRLPALRLRLSVLLRGQLAGLTNAMVTTAGGGTLPNVGSAWAGEILHTVFERYSTMALMREDEWVQFWQDAGVVRLYCTRNEHDEIAEDDKQALDPRTVFRRVVHAQRGSASRASSTDAAGAGFNEFFQLLVLVCDLLGLRIFERPPDGVARRGSGDSLASQDFQQLLHDVIIPLHSCGPGWGQRASSKDSLVSEPRVLLLLENYLPNLWRVFLLYCQDPKGNAFAGPIHSFPACAQRSEHLLFGSCTTTKPAHPTADPKAQALFVTERSMLRCAEHFGLVPQLCTEAVFLRVFRAKASSASKDVAASPGGASGGPRRGPMSPSTGSWSPGMTLSQRKRHGLGHSRRHQIQMQHQREQKLKPRSPLHASPSSPASSPSTRGSGKQLEGTSTPKRKAGFCEFVEILAQMAVVGLDRPPYSTLYPSSFAKVAAMLVGPWGVADPAKLHIAAVLCQQRAAAAGRA